MSQSFDRSLQFHLNALDLRAWRQQLLASNIANADTPGFAARDIDFAKALQAATSGAASAHALRQTATRHLAAANTTLAGAPLLYRGALQPSLDGNTVDLNIERAQFSQNAVRYEANLTFISHQIKTMLAAIQG